MKIVHHGGTPGALAEINVIPLVDIMLVLLIIFMGTAPLLQQGIDVDLPEVNASAVEASKEDLVLAIDGQGKLVLGGDEKNSYSLESLGEKLSALFANKEKKEIYLHADKNIKYGYVVQVMAACQKAGIERIGMVTVPESDQSPTPKTKSKK